MSTRTFADRLAVGDPHEQHVIRLLRIRGWFAEPWGQALVSPEMRTYLWKVKPPTSVRWMPDVVAGKIISGVAHVRYIDAKAGEKWRETGNHDVEIRAVDGAEEFERYSGSRVFYVFTDGGVTTPDRIRACGHKRPGVAPGRTDFYLFARAVCVDLDHSFGPVEP